MKGFQAVRLFPHITRDRGYAHVSLGSAWVLWANRVLWNSQAPQDRTNTHYRTLQNISGVRMAWINNEI